MAKVSCVDKWQRWLDECATRPEYFGESVRRLRVVHCRRSQEEFSKFMYLESRIPVVRMEKAKEVKDVTTDSLVRLRLMIEELPKSDLVVNGKNETLVELVKQLDNIVRTELEERRIRLFAKNQPPKAEREEKLKNSSKRKRKETGPMHSESSVDYEGDIKIGLRNGGEVAT